MAVIENSFPGKTIKRILIIQLRAIGDVVLTTPACAVLKKHFPESEIHFLTGAGITALIKGVSAIDRVISYPYSKNNIFGIFRIMREIRREKYDVVIDYQGTPGTAFLSKFSGAEIRMGWKMKRRQWAYNFTSSANRKIEYVPWQKCRLLQGIGIDEISSKLQISFSGEDLKIAEKYIEDLGLTADQPLINITPLGKRQTRSWEPEKIVQTADLMVQKFNAAVFYNFAPGEQAEIDCIKKLNKFKVHILPAWEISTFAAFLSLVDLHFSYDNGPKHLAIAMGTPTLSLFATDPPQLWNPENSPNHPYILADVPCRFCGLRNCDLMICMKQVTAEQVISEIERIPKFRAKLDKKNSQVRN